MMESFSLLIGHLLGDYIFQNDQMAKNKTQDSLTCLWHCVWYTGAILVTCSWFMPWYLAIVAGVLHYPVDRWRLARKLMSYSGQDEFATGPFSPWSIIVVDNTIHLFVLYCLGMLALHFGWFRYS